jgi:hypothetical protein
MAKFVMEIEFSEKIADDLHCYFQTTTDGKLGFFEVLEENIRDLVKSMDPEGSAKIVGVIYE